MQVQGPHSVHGTQHWAEPSSAEPPSPKGLLTSLPDSLTDGSRMRAVLPGGPLLPTIRIVPPACNSGLKRPIRKCRSSFGFCNHRSTALGRTACTFIDWLLPFNKYLVRTEHESKANIVQRTRQSLPSGGVCSRLSEQAGQQCRVPYHHVTVADGAERRRGQ